MLSAVFSGRLFLCSQLGPTCTGPESEFNKLRLCYKSVVYVSFICSISVSVNLFLFKSDATLKFQCTISGRREKEPLKVRTTVYLRLGPDLAR